MQQNTIGSFQNKRNFNIMGTSQILMPENYIAMFDAPEAEEARKIIAKAEPDIEKVIAYIRDVKEFCLPRNKLYDRFMSGPVNPIFYKFFCESQRISGK